MAIETIPNPATVPTVPDDYEKQNDKATASGKGYCAVSLTNWDTGVTFPEVIIGSIIEANDVFYRVITANETPSISGLSAGTAYLYFDGTGFLFSNTDPTWSTTLNGWYNSTDRFTGHLCTWDGGSSYSVKKTYFDNTSGGNDKYVGAGETLYADIESANIETEDIDVTQLAIIEDLTVTGLTSINGQFGCGLVNEESETIAAFGTSGALYGNHYFAVDYHISKGGTQAHYAEIRIEANVSTTPTPSWVTVEDFVVGNTFTIVGSANRWRVYNRDSNPITIYWLSQATS